MEAGSLKQDGRESCGAKSFDRTKRDSALFGILLDSCEFHQGDMSMDVGVDR